MNFTASSFERMMKQKPRPQAPGPAKPGITPGGGIAHDRQQLPAHGPQPFRLHQCCFQPALCLLLPETFSQAGRREVTLWPAN